MDCRLNAINNVILWELLKLIRLYKSLSIISASRSSTVHLSELFIFIVVKCIVNAFSKLIWMFPYFVVVVVVRKCLFLSQFLSIEICTRKLEQCLLRLCVCVYKSIHTISFMPLFLFIAYSLFAHIISLIFYVYFLFRFFSGILFSLYLRLARVYHFNVTIFPLL